MPKAIAEAVEAPPVVALPQPSILVEVRDVADFGVGQAPAAAAGGGAADFERAKIGREVTQLRVVETLVAKHEYGVAVDRLPDSVDHRPVNALIQVNTANFRGEMRIDLPYIEGHATSSISSGEDPPA
jgi:hypothetical protein